MNSREHMASRPDVHRQLDVVYPLACCALETRQATSLRKRVPELSLYENDIPMQLVFVIPALIDPDGLLLPVIRPST